MSKHAVERRILNALLQKKDFNAVFTTLSDDDVEKCRKLTGNYAEEVWVSLPTRSSIADIHQSSEKIASNESKTKSTNEKIESSVKNVKKDEWTEEDDERLAEYTMLMNISYTECMKYLLEKNEHLDVMLAILQIKEPTFTKESIKEQLEGVRASISGLNSGR